MILKMVSQSLEMFIFKILRVQAILSLIFMSIKLSIEIFLLIQVTLIGIIFLLIRPFSMIDLDAQLIFFVVYYF